MHGPQVGRVSTLPLTESIGSLPYAERHLGRIGRGARIAGLLLAAGAIAIISIFAARSGDTGSGDRAGTAVGRSAGKAAVITSTQPNRRPPPKTSTTTAAHTSAPPAPATTAPQVAKGKLPLHGAVYHQGKLYLSGALPSRKVADAFVKKASEVIGAANVVEHYVIDRRAPVPTEGRVRVDEPFLFPTGSAQIDPRYGSLLDLGVTVMRLNPQVTMKVVGYTDDTGPLPLNLALSRARAQAVADWITQRGIPAQRFVVIGLGPANPLVSNATPEGKTRNRRIEVELLGLLKG